MLEKSGKDRRRLRKNVTSSYFINSALGCATNRYTNVYRSGLDSSHSSFFIPGPQAGLFAREVHVTSVRKHSGTGWVRGSVGPSRFGDIRFRLLRIFKFRATWLAPAAARECILHCNLSMKTEACGIARGVPERSLPHCSKAGQ